MFNGAPGGEMVLFLSNENIQQALSWTDVVQVCEELLLERARGTAWFSPRHRYVLPTDSRLMILPGGLVGDRIMGLRTYSMHPRTSPDSTEHVPEQRLSAHALNVVYDMQSAEMLAITAGERINTLRVGGELAVGAKYLAKRDSKTVGVFGSGRLALGSLMALKETHDIASAKVFSRSSERKKRFATQVSEMAGYPVRPVASPDEALREVDIVVTATSSMEPAFDGRGLEPGVIGRFVRTITVRSRLHAARLCEGLLRERLATWSATGKFISHVFGPSAPLQ